MKEKIYRVEGKNEFGSGHGNVELAVSSQGELALLLWAPRETSAVYADLVPLAYR